MTQVRRCQESLSPGTLQILWRTGIEQELDV
jgi:hypothetical protein